MALDATDSGPNASGVKQITYRVSGAETVSATVVSGASTSITISAEGTTTIAFFATDGVRNVENVKTLSIKIDKTPPSIVAPAPVTVEATSANGAVISNAQLGTPAATDALGPVTISRVPVSNQFSLGTTTVIWTATDGAGNRATALQQVRVRDTTKPRIANVTPSLRSLWPNDQLVPITISVMVSDLVDPAPVCRIASVTSNEGPEKYRDRRPDWLITGALTISLRAERSGDWRALIYTISVMCTDRSGNSAVASTNVVVSHGRYNDHGDEDDKERRER